jgi:hypothetical protein
MAGSANGEKASKQNDFPLNNIMRFFPESGFSSFYFYGAAALSVYFCFSIFFGIDADPQGGGCGISFGHRLFVSYFVLMLFFFASSKKIFEGAFNYKNA